MSRWSPEQVRQSAPDAASLKAASRLARPGPWSDTGATDDLVWGKCQGSGQKPYQVSVDVTAPAFRCSCPSRKFPCKHALALLMMWADGGDIAQVSEASGFAAEWADARAARQTRRDASPPDPEAQERRRQQRLQVMDAGMEDFRVWLSDVMRGGLASLRSREAETVATVAARLVDAQCPALAAEVRDFHARVLSREEWVPAAVRTVGRWWMLVQGWQRRDQLDEDRAATVRAALGWHWGADEVRQRPAIDGTWLVLGAHREETGRLAEQRTWIHHRGTTMVVLDFGAGGNPLPVPRMTGASLRGPVHPYPGSAPRRALWGQDPVSVEPVGFPMGVAVADAPRQVAEHLARNPLAVRVPVMLDNVVLDAGHVSDGDGPALPLAVTPWDGLAATGGHPCCCFGEWEPTGFRVLTVLTEGEVIACD